MRIRIAAAGRFKNEPEALLVRRYEERLSGLGRAIGLHPVEIREIPESRAATVAQRKGEEAARLLELVPPQGFAVILDETGKCLTSLAFAELIRTQRDRGTPTMAFLIGGPDGHGPEIHKSAGLVLSLGAMTLPHALARAVLIEQIYRAATILSGHPYHRS